MAVASMRAAWVPIKEFPDEEGTETLATAHNTRDGTRAIKEFPDEEGTETKSVVPFTSLLKGRSKNSPMRRGLKPCIPSRKDRH